MLSDYAECAVKRVCQVVKVKVRQVVLSRDAADGIDDASSP